MKWVQAMGGRASAKLLLDLYGHFLPSESSGYADAIGAPRRPYTDLGSGASNAARAAAGK